MPIYHVYGVDRESGYDTDLMVHADDAANARAKASLRGVEVTRVEPIERSETRAERLDRSETRVERHGLPLGKKAKKPKKDFLDRFNPWRVIGWWILIIIFWTVFAPAACHLVTTI